MSSEHSPLRRTWAAKQQLEVTVDDVLLTDLARQKNWRVAWWWGKRQEDGHAGARCYLCNDWAVTWDIRWPMTEGARQTLHEHRERHLDELRRG